MILPVKYSSLSPSTRRAVREEYTRVQHGRCHHCSAPLSGPAASEILAKPVNIRLFPTDFFKWSVHLHHDHRTGLTIGAVHAYCNAVSWQYHGK